MKNAQTLYRGLNWQQSWALRLKLRGANRLPRGFKPITIEIEGPEERALETLGRSVISSIREALKPDEAAAQQKPVGDAPFLLIQDEFRL
ncbi:hypothetical protein ACEOSU_20070 [Pseudomonas aeruginosa]